MTDKWAEWMDAEDKVDAEHATNQTSDDVKHASEVDLKSGEYFYINNPVTMRWKPYKPNSEQFKKGIKGRYQEHDGYGWNNSQFNPEEFMK